MGINTQLRETGCSDTDHSLSNDHGKDTAYHRTSENICVRLFIVNAFQRNELFCVVTGISMKVEVEEVCISLHPPLGKVVSSRQTSFFASKAVG